MKASRTPSAGFGSPASWRDPVKGKSPPPSAYWDLFVSLSIRVHVTVFCLGIVVAFWGGQELVLASGSSGAAQRMTCADLAKSGPGENAHVILTEFDLTPEYVTQEERGHWTQVWVRAVPKGGARNALVLLTSRKVRSEKELAEAFDKPELEGTIVDALGKPNAEVRARLDATYQGLSFARVLEVGRKPSGWLLSGGAILLGLVTSIAFFAVLLRRRREQRAEKARRLNSPGGRRLIDS